MPTANNGGLFSWGSAWRLEPRRGNGRCNCTGRFLGLALRLRAQEGQWLPLCTT